MRELASQLKGLLCLLALCLLASSAAAWQLHLEWSHPGGAAGFSVGTMPIGGSTTVTDVGNPVPTGGVYQATVDVPAAPGLLEVRLRAVDAGGGVSAWSNMLLADVPTATPTIPTATRTATRTASPTFSASQTHTQTRTPTLAAPVLLRCDLTGDGTVSSLDAARILAFVVGNRPTCP